jgi:hypothetical protein
MLTPLEEIIVGLQRQGVGFREIARRTGHSYNACKYVAWYSRQKIAAGDPWTMPGAYCLVKYGNHIGVLPLRCLADWQARMETAREKIPWLAAGVDRPELQVLLGNVCGLTFREASTARRALAGRRKRRGVYRVDAGGNVAWFPGEIAAGRAEGVSSMAIHRYRESGFAKGCYWL